MLIRHLLVATMTFCLASCLTRTGRTEDSWSEITSTEDSCTAGFVTPSNLLGYSDCALQMKVGGSSDNTIKVASGAIVKVAFSVVGEAPSDVLQNVKKGDMFVAVPLTHSGHDIEGHPVPYCLSTDGREQYWWDNETSAWKSDKDGAHPRGQWDGTTWRLSGGAVVTPGDHAIINADVCGGKASPAEPCGAANPALHFPEIQYGKVQQWLYEIHYVKYDASDRNGYSGDTMALPQHVSVTTPREDPCKDAPNVHMYECSYLAFPMYGYKCDQEYPDPPISGYLKDYCPESCLLYQQTPLSPECGGPPAAAPTSAPAAAPTLAPAEAPTSAPGSGTCISSWGKVCEDSCYAPCKDPANMCCWKDWDQAQCSAVQGGTWCKGNAPTPTPPPPQCPPTTWGTVCEGGRCLAPCKDPANVCCWKDWDQAHCSAVQGGTWCE